MSDILTQQQCESKKFTPRKFIRKFCLTAQNFKLKFGTLLHVFIQLSLTLTKLCHIKSDRPVNFYISLKKREKLRYLCNGIIDFHEILQRNFKTNGLIMYRSVKCISR